MKYALIFLLSAVAHGEYRAYELAIRNVEAGTEKRVISTLDHLQYTGYYPVGAQEVVAYVTSWQCRGRTGNFRKICPRPGPEAPPTANSSASPPS